MNLIPTAHGKVCRFVWKTTWRLVFVNPDDSVILLKGKHLWISPHIIWHTSQNSFLMTAEKVPDAYSSIIRASGKFIIRRRETEDTAGRESTMKDNIAVLCGLDILQGRFELIWQGTIHLLSRQLTLQNSPIILSHIFFPHL